MFSASIYELTKEYKTGEPVSFETQPLQNDQKSCLEFQYYLNVPREYGLKLVLTNAKSGTERVLWRRFGFQNDIWHTENLYMELKVGDKLSFIASTVSGTIALGKILLNNDNGLSKCKFTNFNTDFEDDITDWDSKNVVVSSIAPHLRDHSSDSPQGKAAYLVNGKIASKPFINPEAKCLEFWYNRPSVNPPRNQTHFAVLVNQGRQWSVLDETAVNDVWLRAQVPLNVPGKGNRIEIVADALSGSDRPGVFLDDIKLLDTACAKPTDCLFQESTCGWTNHLNSLHDHHWSLGKGRVQNVQAFVPHAVPYHFPSHLYADFSLYRPQAGMEIRSEFIPGTGEYCATLTVLFSGLAPTDVFMLEHITQSFDTLQKQTLWTMDTHQINTSPKYVYDQRTYSVEVPSSVRPRRLGLFVRSANAVTRISVSEFKLREGRCKPLATEAPTADPIGPSKLDKATLTIADELMKNSRTNIERILSLIKIEDPIKVATNEVLTKISSAVEMIEKSLK